MQGTPLPPPLFLARPYLRPIDPKSDFFFAHRLASAHWWGGPGTKVSMERPHFGGISIFFAFLGVLGVRGTCVFSGTPKRAKIPKNWVWGPVEAVSGKFSGDLKVARGVSATDEPKKPDFEPLSLIYAENTGSRARRRWGLCPVT